jgi:hypothetical protein
VIRRLLGVLVRPRSTMAEVVAHPQWVLPWLVILALWAICAVPILNSTLGRQALVDEQVRRVEALGGTVDDERYAAMRANPPLLAYVSGGGRLLLTPPVTLAVAMGLILLARRDHVEASVSQALAISVFALVPLALGNAAATPLHYIRESLSSPFNLAALVRVADEGTWAARLLGSVELFGLWWTWLLAVGLAAITKQPSRRYLAWLVVIYVGIAAIFSAAPMMFGGA